MVEVKAGTKECFFEDLHVNDKVRWAVECELQEMHSTSDARIMSL